MDVRPETPLDHDAIRSVVEAAFGRSLEAKLVDDIRASIQFIPALALVAERDGRIVGHVMVSYAALIDGDRTHRVLKLSPLAVDPAHQRTGVGSALVRAVIAEADRMGEPVIVLEGVPAYYPRFGFRHAATLGITHDLPDWAPPEASMAIPLSSYDPAIKGRVVYPAAFHDAAG